jgi:UDP-galactopyranose mutase
MLTVDYVIIGSGLTGAVIARLLADAGREVLVVERRAHLGGNVYDHTHASGIRVHTYGPHYFRTSSDRIWDFATRFAPFYRYEARLVSLVAGQYENWPIAASYIRKRLGPNWAPEFTGTPHHFEEAALALMPRLVYESFVKEYNEKQWGVPAHSLAPELCQRFDVRADDEPRLKPHCKHQGIPECGYAEWMRRMLDGIPVLLNCDYLRQRERIRARKLLVFTGPIDEFFNFDLGRLSYRGQRREHVYLEDTDWAQPCGQVNNPAHADGPHIRRLEWKHMMPSCYAERIRGTVLTREYPFSPTDPGQYEYPFPDRFNTELYKAYRSRADHLDNVLICGRLGEYRYFDMDQAIGRAMTLGERILPERQGVLPTRFVNEGVPAAMSS